MLKASESIINILGLYSYYDSIYKTLNNNIANDYIMI